MEKKDPNKCEKCGHKIALATACLMNIEVEFDQEPYETDVVEPVYIDKQVEETIDFDISITVHICPNCKWVRDLEIRNT